MLGITGKFSPSWLFPSEARILRFGLLLTEVQDIKLLLCFQWTPCLISLSFAFIPNSGISLLHWAHIDAILQTWALSAIDADIIISLK